MESFYTTERLRNSPHAPSTSWEPKISQYRSSDFSPYRLVRQDLTVMSSKSFIHPVPLHLDPSLTTHLEDRANLPSPRSITPASAYSHIIKPPLSASLFSCPIMERHDHENSPIPAAGLPAPPCPVTAPPELRQSPRMHDDFISSNEDVVIHQQSVQRFGNRDSSSFPPDHFPLTVSPPPSPPLPTYLWRPSL